ncbi:hypothetical protein PHYSODRAFT_325464 [Phytophthora sojae]|uniref:Uncharacterized protein n=1 Tax=Phytophthora sojae (strain P6497) TaxID=1094619 RepID=G4YV40_PHYSP|nr:hypothetical protein PHYSODRAFT_325464 [Phytophthora sojae]EGZ24339.1 hypothetical protein PHYSODRAFT_325464 [Phytophthora sojae]|eukprot:XP_009519627.1 hypothetical protein PHYSODRAFT_325464 [Phytophthora sojae]
MPVVGLVTVLPIRPLVVLSNTAARSQCSPLVFSFVLSDVVALASSSLLVVSSVVPAMTASVPCSTLVFLFVLSAMTAYALPTVGGTSVARARHSRVAPIPTIEVPAEDDCAATDNVVAPLFKGRSIAHRGSTTE